MFGLDLLSSQFVALRGAAGAAAWTPLAQSSRSVCLSVLSKIQLGTLEIDDADGTTHVIGQKQRDEKYLGAKITVHKDTFWVRLALFADMVGVLRLQSGRMCGGSRGA